MAALRKLDDHGLSVHGRVIRQRHVERANQKTMPSTRRFPPPWTVEDRNDACFIVKAHGSTWAAPTFPNLEGMWMPNVKLIPKNIEQVREVLIDFPADLEIELEIGVPLDAKTVEDLRLLSTWPHGLGLMCNREGFLTQVRIERARP
jgi:hypothetical protein